MHIARAIGPSPARAEPHDAAAWLPLPDVSGLPPIESLLAPAATATALAEITDVDLVALEAMVAPSPARAEPHDAAAWLPLPDLRNLPPVHELLAPSPEVQAAVLAEAEAVLQGALAAAEAAVAPSPARAEPHDAAAWLPLPDPRELPLPAPPRRRGLVGTAARGALTLLLVVAVVAAGLWVARTMAAPGNSSATPVAGGRGVAAHPSFPVTVDVDGRVRTVRTTSTSAEALGRQLRLGKLVAVRGTPGRLGSGASVAFRTRHAGSLEVDGQTIAYDSPSLTVAELLDSYHVSIVGEDFVTPAADTRLTDGARVQVVRVGAQTAQTTEAFAFTEVLQPDPDLPIGQTREVQKGRNGVYTVTHRQKVENGEVIDDQVVSKVPTTAAQPHIVAFGTKADWHWDELARCESGGRWDTIDGSPGHWDGGLGIAESTWHAFGGDEFAPRAGLATREQQIIVGMRIYDKYGWDPWGCARNALHWT